MWLRLTPGIWDYLNRINVNTGLMNIWSWQWTWVTVIFLTQPWTNKESFLFFFFFLIINYRFPQQPEEGAAESVVLFPPPESENDKVQVQIFVWADSWITKSNVCIAGNEIIVCVILKKSLEQKFKACFVCIALWMVLEVKNCSSVWHWWSF